MENNNKAQKYAEALRKAEAEKKAAEDARRRAIAAEEDARRRAIAAEEDARRRAIAAEEDARRRAKFAEQAAERERIRQRKRKLIKTLKIVGIVLFILLYISTWVIPIVSGAQANQGNGSLRILAIVLGIIGIFCCVIIIGAAFAIESTKIPFAIAIVFSICYLAVFGLGLTEPTLTHESGVLYKPNAADISIVGTAPGAVSCIFDSEDLDESPECVYVSKLGEDLEELTITSDSEVSISDYAFADCKSLKAVTIICDSLKLDKESFADAEIDNVTIECDSMSIKKKAVLNAELGSLSITASEIEAKKKSFEGSDIDVLSLNGASFHGTSVFEDTRIGRLELNDVTAAVGASADTPVYLGHNLADCTFVVNGGSLKYYFSMTDTIVLGSDAELVACLPDDPVKSDEYTIDTLVLASDYTGVARCYYETGIFTATQHLVPVAKKIYIPADVTAIPSYLLGNEGYTPTVYYGGTEEQWNQLIVGADGNDNYSNITVYFNATHDLWN